MTTIKDLMRDCVNDVIEEAQEQKLLTISTDTQEKEVNLENLIEEQLEVSIEDVDQLLTKVSGV